MWPFKKKPAPIEPIEPPQVFWTKWAAQFTAEAAKVQHDEGATLTLDSDACFAVVVFMTEMADLLDAAKIKPSDGFHKYIHEQVDARKLK